MIKATNIAIPPKAPPTMAPRGVEFAAEWGDLIGGGVDAELDGCAAELWVGGGREEDESGGEIEYSI